MVWPRTFPSPAVRGEYTSLVVPSNFRIADFIYWTRAGCPVSPYRSSMQRSQFFTALTNVPMRTRTFAVSSWRLPFGINGLTYELKLRATLSIFILPHFSVFSFYRVPLSTSGVRCLAHLMQPLLVGLVHPLSWGHFFLRFTVRHPVALKSFILYYNKINTKCLSCH